MEKIDRLGWTAGLSFTSYGVRVGVRVNNSEVLDRILEHLPPGWKPTSSAAVELLYSLIVGDTGLHTKIRRFNLLYGNTVRIARSRNLREVFEAFESDLHLHVAEHARGRVFVHAGVVGWHGQAIVIPGRSMSGKTSLVAELVKAGATYYSDEYAVFDLKGRVHPYPRPLAIREDGTGKQTKYSVEDLGGVSGGKRLPVGLVVLSKFKPGARWRPRQLSPGNGALALLDNTISIRRQPEIAFPALRLVASDAPVLKGVRGEAREVVDSILKTMDFMY